MTKGTDVANTKIGQQPGQKRRPNSNSRYFPETVVGYPTKQLTQYPSDAKQLLFYFMRTAKTYFEAATGSSFSSTR